MGFLFSSRINADGRPYVAEGWYLDDIEIVTGEQILQIPERFDSPDVWDHWVAENGTWEIGPLVGAPARARGHDGSYAAGTILAGNYCDTYYGRTNRLVSPITRVPDSPDARLQFRHWYNFSWDDTGSVQIREPGGRWTSLITYSQYQGSCGGWENVSIDISQYAGKLIQIAFQFRSKINADGRTYVAEGWYIDDLELSSAPRVFNNPEQFEASDIHDHWISENGTWQFGPPTGAPARGHDGSNVASTVLTGNYCDTYFGQTNRLSSPFTKVPDSTDSRLRFRHWYNFSWDDSGSVQIREPGAAWVTLATYSQYQGSCGGWESVSLDLGQYAGKLIQIGFQFRSKINADGRAYVAEGWYIDDLEIVAKPRIFNNPESFEREDILDHWIAENGTWQIGPPAGAAARGQGGSSVAGTVLAGNYCDTYYGRTNRLTSPLTRVPDSTSSRLRFRHWYNFSWDDVGNVQIREPGTSWVTLATYSQYQGSCSGWENVSIDIGQYAGKLIQVGFQFRSKINADGRAYVAEGWYIDDLELVAVPRVFNNPESFDGPDVLDHWIADNGTWQIGPPTGPPATGHDGSNVAGTILSGNYCDTYYGSESRLTSPPFRLPRSPFPELQLRHWFDFNFDDYGIVEVRSGAGPWIELGRFSGRGSANWTDKAFDLSRFTDTVLQVGLRIHSRINADGRAYVAPGWYVSRIAVHTGLIRVSPESILSEGLSIPETNAANRIVFRVGGAADGQTYGLSQAPASGPQLDPLLGLCTWAPDECDGPGLHWLRVGLFEPGNALRPVDFADVPIFVTEVPSPPIAMPMPLIRTVARSAVSVNVSGYVTDLDCPTNQLTYALDVGPSGMLVNPNTGVLSWTPSPEQAAATNLFVIRITDD
ncbi:MAG: hypothetical protein AB7O66_22205, partial [Limisphaerales bacterium]